MSSLIAMSCLIAMSYAIGYVFRYACSPQF